MDGNIPKYIYISSLAVWANAQICSLLESEFTVSLTEMIEL